MDTRPNVRVLGRRFRAFLIDGLVFSIFSAFLLNPTFAVEDVTSGSPFPNGGFFIAFSTIPTLNGSWQMLFACVYYFLQEALFGATLGKDAMRLRVVGADGRRLTWYAALVRNLVRPIDSLFGLVGAMLILLSPRRQRLGDYLACTLVADAASVQLTPCSPGERHRRQVVLLTSLALLIAFCVGFSYYFRPPLLIESWSKTGDNIFTQPVASYTLGSPRWDSGTVTYPIQYELVDSRRTCSGTIALEWAGFPQGWNASNSQSQCNVRQR
jgi:uncharacterized RDD family membrane protein YckC